MRTVVVLLAAALASGCGTVRAVRDVSLNLVGLGNDQIEAPHAQLSPGLTLSLPTPPNYPEPRLMQQTVRADYGDNDGVFESLLTLGPDEVELVVTAVSGPRLATITWDRNGIHKDALPIVPNLPVENILADIFVCLWPVASVQATLPEGYTLVEAENGAREILGPDGAVILSATPDPDNAARITVRNLALGYEVMIVNRVLE